MKKAYFLVVLFLSGLSVENAFAAAPSTWTSRFRTLLPRAATRDLGRELLKAFRKSRPNKAKIERLIKAGANPNTTDENGYTALMYAAIYGYADIVQLLLDTEADVNIQDNIGEYTALILAALYNHADIVELLLQEGADVNAQENGGQTALMYVAMQGDADMVQLLLDHGADTDMQNTNGKTAEELARDRGHEKIANMIRDFKLPSGRLTKPAGRN